MPAAVAMSHSLSRALDHSRVNLTGVDRPELYVGEAPDPTDSAIMRAANVETVVPSALVPPLRRWHSISG